MKTENPGMTLESIGEEVDVSREYVRQVLAAAGVDTKKETPTCFGCGIALRPSVERPYTDIKTGHRYCKTCRHDMVWGKYSCAFCQKELIRRKSDIRRTNPRYIFCDKQCQGKYIGKHYGRRANKRT